MSRERSRHACVTGQNCHFLTTGEEIVTFNRSTNHANMV